MAKLVAKVYGDALFAAALEAGRMDEMYEEICELRKILGENEDLQKLLDNPKIIREEKESVMENIFRGRVSDEIVEWMKRMIAKGRYSQIESVFDYVIGLVKEEKKIGIAYVASALPLTGDQKANIIRRLLDTTKYEQFEMNYSVDKSLIGGVVIRIGDRVVDSSIKTKLYELSKDLRKIQV